MRDQDTMIPVFSLSNLLEALELLGVDRMNPGFPNFAASVEITAELLETHGLDYIKEHQKSLKTRIFPG